MFKFFQILVMVAVIASGISVAIVVSSTPTTETAAADNNAPIILGHRVTPFGQTQLVTRN